VVTWPAIVSLAPGGSITDTLRVTAPASGNVVNVGAATTTSTDPNGANNRSSFTTSVTPVADVQVTKTGPASVSAGAPITYTIQVSNAGPSAAASVVLTDSLPAGVTFVSASRGGAAAGNVVTWPAIVSLASGASVTDTVVVTAPASGSLTNVAVATTATAESSTANNRSTVATTVTDLADLQVTKTGPASVNAGATITYAIVTSNAGPSAAASVVVSDTLPAGVTFVSATRSGAAAGGVVTWPTIASLASGASVTDTVIVTAPASGSLTNVARATTTTPESSTANNRGTVATTVTPVADVQVTKTGPNTVNQGDTISYTITVTNVGPSGAADVVVTDTLPTNATFVDATGGVTPSGGVLTFATITNLSVGSPVSFTVRVVAPLSSGASVVNTAAATSTTADPDTSNNKATKTTGVT
jgi:uncharacterized repeat protein (TIGR01451 family)